MGDVALRSEGMQAVIAGLTQRGAAAAATASGEDTAPQVEMGKERWYGTYGVSARAEASDSAASNSVGSM